MFRYVKISIQIVLGILLLTSCKNYSYDFEENKADMKIVAEEIAHGEYEITENGLVELADEYAHLSDTGEVCMVLFNGKPAIYFWTDRGMLESSKGYIYVLDVYEERIVDSCLDSYNFVNIKEIGERWYSVSTNE